MIFETERLRIRPWTEADVEAAFRIYSNPEVTRFLGSGGKPISDVDEQLARIRHWRDRDRDLRPDLGFWAMDERELGPIGSVILRPLPNDTKVEVGWHLGFDHWGKGYATEAAQGAIRHGFDTASLTEIYAIVQAENTQSIRVTERVGMEPLGTTDAYHDMELLFFRIAEG
ncbi:MAG: GNAT family N-acetyltransferase [Armatimonadota bacterium]|nr:GNAT family N-acetyltransferase [Armatimonadota bacterium]